MKFRAKAKGGAIEEAWIEIGPRDEGDQTFPCQMVDRETETIEGESEPFDMAAAMQRIVATFELDEDGLLVIVKD